jgi:hypothetical protein
MEARKGPGMSLSGEKYRRLMATVPTAMRMRLMMKLGVA